MAVKERRTKILLALFLLTDIKFDYIVLDDKVQAVFDIYFNQKTRGTLSGLLKEGCIEKGENSATKITNDVLPALETHTTDPSIAHTQSELDSAIQSISHDTSTYKITEKGFHELCLDFPIFRFMKETWDGKWRILSYEIPEKKRDLRDRLRREVAGWGLGPWHRSFWLTPHPIIRNLKLLISQKEEEQYVQAFESEHVFGDRENLIEKVWQKSLLDKKYRELFKKWHDILSKEEEKSSKLKMVVDEYIVLLRLDPGLPAELIGKTWIGYEAFQIFKEIRGILLS